MYPDRAHRPPLPARSYFAVEQRYDSQQSRNCVREELARCGPRSIHPQNAHNGRVSPGHYVLTIVAGHGGNVTRFSEKLTLAG
jgi:hypothetical protein